jgi:hypothetical protein
VAFTARYLNDQRLYEKLDKLADESRDKGDLQGILLTGLDSLVYSLSKEIFLFLCRIKTNWL